MTAHADVALLDRDEETFALRVETRPLDALLCDDRLRRERRISEHEAAGECGWTRALPLGSSGNRLGARAAGAPATTRMAMPKNSWGAQNRSYTPSVSNQYSQ